LPWREDLIANTGRSGFRAAAVAWVTSPGFVVVTWWRLARWLRSSGWAGRVLSWIILRFCLMRRGCYLSLLAEIGPGLVLPHPTGIVVGDGVRLGRSVTLYQNVTLGRPDAKTPVYPKLEDGVVVYAGAVVIGSVTIGRAATVAANAVVNRDVMPGAVVAGAPAKMVSTRS
jgi:serine O-acetyltransferase